MKKIRLTESQLIDLIKKSLNDTKTINEAKSQNKKQLLKEYSIVDSGTLAQTAKYLLSNMTGDVDLKRLQSAYTNINSVRNLFWEDGTCAVDKLLSYYQGFSIMGNSFLSDLKGSSEWRDPAFDDLKAKIPTLIAELQQACVNVKKQEADAAVAKANSLQSCASKEPGFIQYSNKISFGVPLGKKGYITAYNDGRDVVEVGKNITYWEYARFHKGKTEDVLLARTKGTCVNGVLNLDAWVKI